jgi:hypothetical protein
MAWKRSDWNDIIQRVNALCTNPDPGCDALSTLDEVPENHKWSVGDITSVRNKLTEICDENTFSAELVKWKQDIIDEIEAAIDAGWCNCCADCSNAFGTVVTYLGSVEQTGCSESESPDCSSSYDQAEAYGLEALSQMELWSDAHIEYCALQDQLTSLNAQLDSLQSQLVALEAERDEVCPEEPACSVAQAAVTAKSEEIAEKQSEIDSKQSEIDQKQGEMSNYESEAETKALLSTTQAEACTPLDPVYLFLSAIESTPWVDTDCDDSSDPRKCRVTWNISTRATIHWWFGGSTTYGWVSQMYGHYTLNGTPFVTVVASSGLTRYAVFGDCGDPDHYNSYTQEIRLTKYYPEPEC